MSRENRGIPDENPMFSSVLSRRILILVIDWSELLQEKQQYPTNETHSL